MKKIQRILLLVMLIAASGVLHAQQAGDPSVNANPDVDGSAIEPISSEELEQILAPIALYPDTVLSHILVAATYPLEVIQAERWTARNPDLEGAEAVEAVDDRDWDPSVRALVAFPHILKRMSDELEWMQRLGDAFLQDEEELLASVQSLRQRAYRSGNLDDLDKLSVSREREAIIIEPVEREVVYLPYYDTRVVYGAWHDPYYPPVYWDCPYHDHHYSGRHHSAFHWGPGFDLSFGFFFSSLHWRNRHVVRIPYHHYRPRHYYNHHQILRHNHARRWHHSVYHRRGMGYRGIRDGKRYHHPKYNQRGNHRGNHRNNYRGDYRTEQTRIYPQRSQDRKLRGSDRKLHSSDQTLNDLKNARIENRSANKPRPANRAVGVREDNSRISNRRQYRADTAPQRETRAEFKRKKRESIQGRVPARSRVVKVPPRATPTPARRAAAPRVQPRTPVVQRRQPQQSRQPHQSRQPQPQKTRQAPLRKAQGQKPQKTRQAEARQQYKRSVNPPSKGNPARGRERRQPR